MPTVLKLQIIYLHVGLVHGRTPICGIMIMRAMMESDKTAHIHTCNCPRPDSNRLQFSINLRQCGHCDRNLTSNCIKLSLYDILVSAGLHVGHWERKRESPHGHDRTCIFQLHVIGRFWYNFIWEILLKSKNFVSS